MFINLSWKTPGSESHPSVSYVIRIVQTIDKSPSYTERLLDKHFSNIIHHRRKKAGILLRN